jgi:hypothetical protein
MRLRVQVIVETDDETQPTVDQVATGAPVSQFADCTAHPTLCG